MTGMLLTDWERSLIEGVSERLATEISRDNRHLRPDGSGAGGLLLALAREHRDLGLARALLKNNLEAGKPDLEVALHFLRTLIGRVKEGDHLATPWLVHRDARDAVLIPLFLGDRNLATEVGEEVLNLTFPNHEAAEAKRADLACLVGFIWGTDNESSLKKLREALKTLPPTSADLTLYARFYDALLNGDQNGIISAILAVSMEVPNLLPRFDLDLTPYVSLEGMALRNLAILSGRNVPIEDKRFPPALLVSPSK